MVGKAARLSKEVLEAHYHLPMAEVAKKFEVCMTYFKKVCRQNGVKRWPYRQVMCQPWLSVDKCLLTDRLLRW